MAQRLAIDPDTLRRGYSEAGERARGDPNLPRNSEVARRYVASVRQIRALQDWREASTEIREPAKT